MKGDRDVVLFRIDRKIGLLMLALLVVVIGGFALSETLTVSTSYPVPSGIYNQLVTTGNSGTVPANTTLNLNAGNTILVPPSNGSGNVGIGTASPTAKLTVNGGIQVGGDNMACPAQAAPGTMRWTAPTNGHLQVCCSTGWNDNTNCSVCVSNGTCNGATPACGKTGSGTDNCGNTCTLTGPKCGAPPGQQIGGIGCGHNGACNGCYVGVVTANSCNPYSNASCSACASGMASLDGDYCHTNHTVLGVFCQ